MAEEQIGGDLKCRCLARILAVMSGEFKDGGRPHVKELDDEGGGANTRELCPRCVFQIAQELGDDTAASVAVDNHDDRSFPRPQQHSSMHVICAMMLDQKPTGGIPSNSVRIG